MQRRRGHRDLRENTCGWLGSIGNLCLGKSKPQSSVELSKEAGFEQRYYECDAVGLDGVLVSPITSSFRTQRGGRVRGFRALRSYV